MTEGASKPVDLGKQAMTERMIPGEVHLGNWSAPRVGFDFDSGLLIFPASPFWLTADQQVQRLRESGQYSSVRQTTAFDIHGKALEEMAAIVVTPILQEPTK